MRRRATIIEPVPPPEEGAPAGRPAARLLWFVAIAAASALVIAAVAYALRALPFMG